MTDKVFLVKSPTREELGSVDNGDWGATMLYNMLRQFGKELTPSDLSQQFLSKELVLRKLDSGKNFNPFDDYNKGYLNALKWVLNECSATPENSNLLKKLSEVSK